MKEKDWGLKIEADHKKVEFRWEENGKVLTWEELGVPGTKKRSNRTFMLLMYIIVSLENSIRTTYSHFIEHFDINFEEKTVLFDSRYNYMKNLLMVLKMPKYAHGSKDNYFIYQEFNSLYKLVDILMEITKDMYPAEIQRLVKEEVTKVKDDIPF